MMFHSRQQRRAATFAARPRSHGCPPLLHQSSLQRRRSVRGGIAPRPPRMLGGAPQRWRRAIRLAGWLARRRTFTPHLVAMAALQA
jgi:hypothetical protein